MRRIVIHEKPFKAQCENKELLWDFMMSFMGRYYFHHQDEFVHDCHFHEVEGIWKAEVTDIWNTDLEDRTYEWQSLTKDHYRFLDG